MYAFDRNIITLFLFVSPDISVPAYVYIPGNNSSAYAVIL